MNFFSYDPLNDGLQFHETLEQAQNKADESLKLYRHKASDGWPEDITEICWGEVCERVELISTDPAPEGSSFDTIDDYALVPPPVVVESFAERMDRLSNALRATGWLHCTKEQAPVLVAAANLLLTLAEKEGEKKP